MSKFEDFRSPLEPATRDNAISNEVLKGLFQLNTRQSLETSLTSTASNYLPDLQVADNADTPATSTERPAVQDTGSPNTAQHFGQRLSQSLNREQRSAVHQDLAQRLEQVRRAGGRAAAQQFVNDLNTYLQEHNGPFRTRIPAGSGDYISITDAAGELVATRRFVPENEMSTQRFAQRLSQQLNREQRAEVHRDLAEQLEIVRRNNGREAAQQFVNDLNRQLTEQNAPVRTRIPAGSGDFISITDTEGELIATRRYFPENAAELNGPQDFAQRLSQRLNTEQRNQVHLGLAQQLERVRHNGGPEAAQQFINELNTRLAQQNAPFRTRIPIGSGHFVSITDPEGELIATRRYYTPPTDPN